MTCASRASLASRRPISTAALPPTPASTSSKTNVGTGSAPANTTSIASITLDNSPPEAPLCSGSAGAPGCAASLISTSSPPCGPYSGSGLTTTFSRDGGVKPRGSILPDRGELSAELAHGGGKVRLLRLQALDPVVVAVQLGQPRRGPLRPCQ